MVVEDMRNTGILGMPEEWFLPWDSTKKKPVNWKQALGGVFKKAQTENGVAAVKVMANQVGKVEQCLSTFMDHDEEKPFGRFASLADAAEYASFVWLKRDDVVFQAISRVIARQTGINHATGKKDDAHFAGNLLQGYDPSYNKKAKYNFDLIRKEAANITLENLLWQNFFSAHEIEPLTLTYEQVSQDPKMRHLDKIADEIGLAEEPKKEERKMVKLGNVRNQSWRDLFYSEVATRDLG